MGTQVAQGQQQGPHSRLEETHLPAESQFQLAPTSLAVQSLRNDPLDPCPAERPGYPEVSLERPRPLPSPLARPAQPCGDALGLRYPSQPVGRSDPGPRAAPSPAPAPVSHGRSSRQRRTAHSTGCSAPSWCNRETLVPRACQGCGKGRGDRPGWAPAARASQRRDYLIAWSEEERGGGAGRPHPPASWGGRGARRGRGGDHCSSLHHHPIPLCGFPRTCKEG